MTTTSLRVVGVQSVSPAESKTSKKGSKKRSLHRIKTVRKQQSVSLRSAARRLGKDMATVRTQDQESSDLSLSELYDWQEALEVPLTDLLVDPGTPLSSPVMERARMLRLMKTAKAIQDRATETPVQRMAQMLVEQLTEIMPELAEVTPWHTVGQRRSLDECGAIAENPISEQYLGQAAGNPDW